MTNRQVRYRAVDEDIRYLVEAHGNQPENLLDVLVSLQSIRGCLDTRAITDVARVMDLPPAQVYGVATFYSMLNVSDTPIQQASIRVCDGPVCWLCGGGLPLMELVADENPGTRVERSSCLGLCDRAPAALVMEKQAGPLTSAESMKIKTPIPHLNNYSLPLPGEMRVMLAHAGEINPESIESALNYGVYSGLKAALGKKPQAVISEVETSGLTGRGGAGFPVGRKWRYVSDAVASRKIVICNADESEPLIFKDRVLIDTNPHQLLEGMAIAGYATGADTGYIYIRGEYISQARRLESAVRQAGEAGWLGEKIGGSGFTFHIHVHCGAGAYICGEETALIKSLEGKRGEPRLRPPYPPTHGFKTLPTLVNNVESFCAVPHILTRGADWYRHLTNYPVSGTKLYMVLGHVNHPGLFEAPFGLTLRRIIDEFGGGMRNGSSFQFALCGGAAGMIVNEKMLDIPIDYSSSSQGITLGAGAFLVCDQNVSPVAFLREIMHFFTVKSCGKCTPCRAGTQRSHELLIRLADGRGQKEDIQELLEMATVMQATSFCGLGQSVHLPVKSALDNFGSIFLDGVGS